MQERELDMRGTKCPLPLLRAQKLMLELGVGDILTLVATDSMAPVDIAEYCERTGHVLRESRENDGVYTMVIVSQSAEQCH